MTIDQLNGSHVGTVVALRQAEGSGKVELVGVLSSYELQWTDGKVVRAWLVVGGREHQLENPVQVGRTALEAL